MSPFTVDALTGPPDDVAETRPFTELARTSLVAPLTVTPPLTVLTPRRTPASRR